MSKFAVIATVDVVPEQMEAYLPLALAHRDRCRANEPGTLVFEYLRDADNPARLHIYEVYTDEAAFQAHARGASRDILQRESAGMVTKLTLVKAHLIP